MNALGFVDLLSATALSHPLHRPRYSDQTWINQRALADPVLDQVTERYNVFRLLPGPNIINRTFSNGTRKAEEATSILSMSLLARNRESYIRQNKYPVLDDR